jgi:hypothetical protein
LSLSAVSIGGLKEVKRIEVILIKEVPLTNLFLRRYK